MEKEEITIAKIAEDLGISATTVSRALSGKGRVSEETRQRIFDYVNDQNLTPNVRTSEYSNKKTMNICVTVPKEKDYAEMQYFNQMLMFLYDFFAVRGYGVFVIKTEAGNIGDLKEIIRKHKVDGVILTRVLPYGGEIEYLKEKKVPFVVIGTCEDEDVYQVDADQRRGCHDLVDILFKMKFRRMAFFSAALEQTVSKNRMDGFLDALRENDIPIERKLIVENARDRDVLEKAVNDMLKEQVECIVCSDDGVCMSLLNYFRELNISVPRDISVASFYNSLILERYYPPVTSLEFDIREWAKAAGQMLLQQLEGNECEKRKVVGYRILLKDSTIFTDRYR